MGAKVYNELPLDIRQTEIYKEFVENLKCILYSNRGHKVFIDFICVRFLKRLKCNTFSFN